MGISASILTQNRPYSKVNKSTRAKVEVIFIYFWFIVITLCVVATIKKCELVFEAK
jgi:hypothetical protein